MNFACAVCGLEISEDDSASMMTLGTSVGHLFLIELVVAHAQCWETWSEEFLRPHPDVNADFCGGCLSRISEAQQRFAASRSIRRGARRETLVEHMRFHDACWPDWAQQYTRPFRPTNRRVRERTAEHQLAYEQGAQALRLARRLQLESEGFDAGLISYLATANAGHII